jgi:hypothetical protein
MHPDHGREAELRKRSDGAREDARVLIENLCGDWDGRQVALVYIEEFAKRAVCKATSTADLKKRLAVVTAMFDLLGFIEDHSSD